MMGSEIKKVCGFDGDVLAYLYDEASGPERSDFEAHLETCETCIEEFALLSEARFPVYEWKMLEFAHMETPPIVLPIARESVIAGWFTGFRASLTWPQRIFAVGTAAATLIVIGVFGFVISRNTTEPNEVVQATVSANSSSPARRPEDPPDLIALTSTEQKPDGRVKKVNDVKAVAPATQSASRVQRTFARTRPVPTLNGLEEDEDKSLRLADLFNDLDTRDLE